MHTVNILNIPFSTMTLDETTSYLKQYIHSNQSLFHLITVNPEIAMIAQIDEDFQTIVQKADSRYGCPGWNWDCARLQA